MKTRGVTGLVASRITSEQVSLDYAVSTPAGDGSEVVSYATVIRAASVGVLQPEEIERLEKAGIVVRNGAVIVIKEAPSGQPDRIIYGATTYRILSWTFHEEYETDKKYGTVVTLCDESTIAGIAV